AQTLTAEDGSFSIRVTPQDVLVITSVNYETQEITVGGNDNLAVTMRIQAGQLSDVVVVGYGTQKRVNLTGSVATVTAKDIADRPITNVSSSLAGLMPGVFV